MRFEHVEQLCDGVDDLERNDSERISSVGIWDGNSA